MLNASLKTKTADTIVELHTAFRDIRDYREFPNILESELRKLFSVDWLAFYVLGQGPMANSIEINPSLPIDWYEKYVEFYDIDKIRIDSINLPIGGTYIYQMTDGPGKDEEIYLVESIEKYTGAAHFLSLHTAKCATYDSGIVLYRSRENQPFSAYEKQILDYLSPIMVSFTNTMILYSEFDFKRVSIDKLVNSQKTLTFTLNDRLVPVDIPSETESFLNRHFPSVGPGFLPEPIDRWIRCEIAPKGFLANYPGPWIFNMSLPEMDLYCKAHAVFTEMKKLALVVLLIPNNRPEDFSILEMQGLTRREIETLSYLPLGYANKQIAMAMDIEEVTVKKHLKNAAQKLDATGKTDTLYKALQQKDLLETLHL